MMPYHDALSEKYGHTFLFGFGPRTRLIVNEPDLLADILSRNNASNYIKPVEFKAEFVPLVGHRSLLVAEGSEHEGARRMINPAFHHVHLKSMVSIITEQTAKAIESTLATMKPLVDDPDPVDPQILFNTLTLSIIVSSAFGADFESNPQAKDIICRVLGEVLDATQYRSMRLLNQIPLISRLPFWRKDVLDSGTRKISEFVDQIITDRRQERSASMCGGPDLLDLLLSAVDDHGQPFTDQEIKEESLTFVLAGSETTGNLMVWMLYVLMTDPGVLRACREEVDRVLPDGVELTNEHLAELPVCEAMIHEALRLYPPAPFLARYCIREHTIGSERKIRIPAGTTIIMNTYTLHRRSDLWPRSLEFDHTRWMRDPKTDLKPKLPHPFAYLPFAAGPRNCIGQNFALLEAKIMLAILVQRCEFELVAGQKIVPDVKITMRARYGLFAKITPRVK